MFTNQGVIVGGVYIGETKKRVLNRSIEQLQLNIPKIVMGGLIGCTQKHLQNCFNIHERKIRELLEINNLETIAEYDKSIKVLNRDRGNIVNTNSWKPLFRKINMIRHANAMK